MSPNQLVELECRIALALAALSNSRPAEALYWAEELRRLSQALASAYRARLVGVRLGEPIGVTHTSRLLGRLVG